MTWYSQHEGLEAIVHGFVGESKWMKMRKEGKIYQQNL